MKEYIFYILALISILSGILMVWTRDLYRAAFALMALFLAVAGIYILSGAYFLGVAQIMIYVGGILILILFGIMITYDKRPGASKSALQNVVPAAIICLLFLAAIVYVSTDFNFMGQEVQEVKTVKKIGATLMSSWVYGFEISGFLLLAALVGAITLAAHKPKN